MVMSERISHDVRKTKPKATLSGFHPSGERNTKYEIQNCCFVIIFPKSFSVVFAQ